MRGALRRKFNAWGGVGPRLPHLVESDDLLSLVFPATLPPQREVATPNNWPNNWGDLFMGRGILLWMLGVPIPIILLLAMCSHH